MSCPCDLSTYFIDPLGPMQNAFSTRLSKFGFNYFSMVVVDLLHEFELGVWKAVFAHLICLLYACGGDAIQQLNERYQSFFDCSPSCSTQDTVIVKYPPLEGISFAVSTTMLQG